MWPGENSIGKRFACCEVRAERAAWTPCGMRSSAWWRMSVHWGLDRQAQPEFYIPVAQMPACAVGLDWPHNGFGACGLVVVRFPSASCKAP